MPVSPTSSPTLLGLDWGVLATWWVGMPLGCLLALAARVGAPGPKLVAGDLVRPVACLMLMVGGVALVAGVSGWWLAARGALTMPAWLATSIPPARGPVHRRLVGAWDELRGRRAGGSGIERRNMAAQARGRRQTPAA